MYIIYKGYLGRNSYLMVQLTIRTKLPTNTKFVDLLSLIGIYDKFPSVVKL